MPVFFFHLHDRGELIEDLEGQTFADVGAARKEAEAAGREMLAAKVLAGELLDGQRIDIADENGRIVDVVQFRQLLRLPSKNAL